MLIAQITDAHVLPEGQAFRGVVDTGAGLAAAVAALNALHPRPDIVLFTGDLANDGQGAEYDRLRALLAPLELPLAAVPGNHDRRAGLRAALAGNPWLPAGTGPEDETTRLHQVIEGFALRLIGLDTLDAAMGNGGSLGREDCAWLEARLAEAPDRPTVIFMHHPPFATGIGHMDAIACTGAGALARVVARHPQVLRLLCGHVHRPVTTGWAGTVACIAPALCHQVALDLDPEAEAAFVQEPPALMLHLWRPGGGEEAGAGLVSHILPLGDHGPARSFATGQPR